MSIVIFLIILLILVLVHESGHFFTAKKFGIRVDEFGFGFPPKLFGYRYRETEYTFNLLPLGGFVKIFGENPDNENTNGPDRERSFVNKPRWQQAIVLFAGVFANFVLAWLLFSIGFMSGLPTAVGSESQGYPVYDVHTVILSVMPNSPAETAGLKSGDKIVSLLTVLFPGEVDKEGISDINPETVKSFVISHKDHAIRIGYIRGKNSEIQYAELSPVVNVTGETPSIGISMDQIGIAKLPFLKAFKEGAYLTCYLTKGTLSGLYGLITMGLQGRGSLASITGPVGMVGIVNDAYKFGFVYLMSFAGLISVNLGIINLLPFPALDGGRLFFLLIEKIKGSRINPQVTNTANMIGFGILLLLMLVVTYNDVMKLF